NNSRTVSSSYKYWHGAQVREIVHPTLASGGPLQTTIEYDDLGRRTVLIDPDAGTQRSLNDGFDQVKFELDASGTGTSYTHDMLGRLTLIETPATNSYPARPGWPYARRDAFVYDENAPNGLGMLSTATANASLTNTPRADAVVTIFGYDALGRLEN